MNQKALAKKNEHVFIALSIIVFALIVSLSFLIPTGGISMTYRTVRGIFPRFADYSAHKELTENVTDLDTLLEVQPKLSYSDETNIILVELSAFDCIDCARMYGYGVKEKPAFSKLFDDFIKSGKMDYMWIDNYSTGDIKKHEALYCAGEQDPRKFFAYKNKLFESYEKDFNETEANNIANSVRTDLAEFTSCYQSGKYNSRVQAISSIASSNVTSVTPSFLVVTMRTKTTTNLDGTKETVEVPEYTDIIQRQTNYELNIKPVLEQYTS